MRDSIDNIQKTFSDNGSINVVYLDDQSEYIKLVNRLEDISSNLWVNVRNESYLDGVESSNDQDSRLARYISLSEAGANVIFRTNSCYLYVTLWTLKANFPLYDIRSIRLLSHDQLASTCILKDVDHPLLEQARHISKVLSNYSCPRLNHELGHT